MATRPTTPPAWPARHPADRTRPRPVAHGLGMHRARVLGAPASGRLAWRRPAALKLRLASHATKIKRLSIDDGRQRRPLIHSHSTNRINRHLSPDVLKEQLGQLVIHPLAPLPILRPDRLRRAMLQMAPPQQLHHLAHRLLGTR